jgi:hypothetical protein
MSGLSYSSLIPPNLFIVVTVVGVLLVWRRARLGLAVATIGGALLYLASMPIVADGLLWSVEALARAIDGAPSDMHAAAIIVLSGDFRHGYGAGSPDTVGRLTLEGLAGAASERRRTGTSNPGQRRAARRCRRFTLRDDEHGAAERFPCSRALA